jgi:hypothetical protein
MFQPMASANPMSSARAARFFCKIRWIAGLACAASPIHGIPAAIETHRIAAEIFAKDVPPATNS